MSKRGPNVKTPLARLAYAQQLFEPKAKKNSTTKQFGCTLLIPKTADLTALKNEVVAVAVADWGEKAKDLLASGLIKSPFLDGDGKQGLNKDGGRKAGHEGHFFIRTIAGEKYPPQLVSKDPKIRITSEAQLYSGCYVYAVVNAFTYDHPENGKGVSFGVSAVQFVRDGERLGGGFVDPESVFDTIADEGEAPAATQNGAGAAGLFG